MYARTVDTYRQERQKSIDYTCQLFGISRQGFYKRKNADKQKLSQAIDLMDKVRQIRRVMQRVGTRKLFHLLGGVCDV